MKTEAGTSAATPDTKEQTEQARSIRTQVCIRKKGFEARGGFNNPTGAGGEKWERSGVMGPGKKRTQP